MKRILTILSAILLIFLAGCSSKDGSKTYVLEKSGVKTEITVYYESDKVTKQTTVNTMNYEKMAVSKDELKDVAMPVSEKYQGIDGVEQKIVFDDDKAVETLTIDYTKVDLKKLKDLPGMDIDTDVESVSLKDTEESLLSQGFTKK
ncbi:YehR family lipoprotein [Gemella sanguinis]